MREILFRGKRVDNGEWVEGGYNAYGENTIIENDVRLYSRIEVIPETVGQFTGLCDKNGKKIFEGDIMALAGWASAGCYEYPNEGDECTAHAKIVFVEGKFIPELGKGYEDLEFMEDAFETYKGKIDGEIIGTIHDNPELLEIEYEQ